MSVVSGSGKITECTFVCGLPQQRRLHAPGGCAPAALLLLLRYYARGARTLISLASLPLDCTVRCSLPGSYLCEPFTVYAYTRTMWVLARFGLLYLTPEGEAYIIHRYVRIC